MLGADGWCLFKHARTLTTLDPVFIIHDAILFRGRRSRGLFVHNTCQDITLDLILLIAHNAILSLWEGQKRRIRDSVSSQLLENMPPFDNTQ